MLQFIAYNLRRVLWHLHWWFIRTPVVFTLDTGLTLTLPESGSSARLYYTGSSEPDTVQVINLLEPGMTYIDVGAHVGEFALRAAQRVGPHGQVFAFEPIPAFADVIRQNAEANGLNNVTVEAMALADQQSRVNFVLRPFRDNSSIMHSFDDGHSGPVIEVLAMPLDDYLTEHGISRVHLLKIDVEGVEYRVLRGAADLMNQPPETAPLIWFEYLLPNYTRYSVTGEMVLNMLHDASYQVYSLDAAGWTPFIPSEEDETRQSVLNLLATKGLPSTRA